MSKITKIIPDFSEQISEKISIGSTSATLVNNLDKDGIAIPSGYYYFTLDANNTLKEYIYCYVDGNELTLIQSVSCQGVKTAGTKREHRALSSIEITNFGHIKLLNDILRGDETLDADNPIKYDAEPSLTDDKELATKKYADDQTIQEPASATESVIGITKLSVAPEDEDNPIALGDNDGRVPTTDKKAALAGSYGTPSSTNKFVTADNSALDNNVDLDNNQNVAGLKTFTSIPVMPGNPTTDNQISNKAYADSLLS